MSKRKSRRSDISDASHGRRRVVPMTAMAVAVLLFGAKSAKRMKARWVRRKGFLPDPIKAGKRRSGQAARFDALELIRAAVCAGDTEPEAAERALRVISQLR